MTIQQEKHTPKDLLDVITYYTPRNQAAIFLTLEYVNMGLGKVMPYVGFFPYEDDYYRMVEHICMEKPDDEILSRILEIMMMDLRTIVGPMEKCFTKTGRIRKNSKYSIDNLMSYCTMMDAVKRILKIFSTMPEADINRLLDDRTLEDGVLYFNEIEKLSDRIMLDMMNGMMNTFNPVLKPV